MSISLISVKIDNSAVDLSKNLPQKVFRELADLYGFANFTKELIEIDFDFSGQKLKLKKDYSKGTLDLYIDGNHTFENFFEYISKITNQEFTQENLNSRIINIESAVSIEDFKTLLEQKNIKLKESTNSLKSDFQKIKDYEQKMDFVVKTEIKAQEKEQEVDNMQKLSIEIQDYMIIQNAIKDDLSFYKQEVNRDLAGKNISELKAERLFGEQKLQLTNSFANFLVRKDEDDFAFRAKGLLILIILQFLITVSLYFGSFSKTVIIVGLFGLFLQILNLILLNLLESPVDLQFYNKEPEVEPNPTDIHESRNAVFVKSAWAKALETELQKLQSSILNILHNRTYNDFRVELDNKSKELAKMNAAIITTALNSMSREEYTALKERLKNLAPTDFSSTGFASNTSNVYNEVMPLFVVSNGGTQTQLVQQIKEFLKENNVVGQVFYVKE